MTSFYLYSSMHRIMSVAFSFLFLISTVFASSSGRAFQSPKQGNSLQAASSFEVNYIEDWKTTPPETSLEVLLNLQRQSLFIFQRNMNWLKSYSRSQPTDLVFRAAFNKFLKLTLDQVIYNENPIPALRIIIELESQSIFIAKDLTRYMNNRWAQRSFELWKPAIFVETLLMLLEWHHQVAPSYESNWTIIAEEFANHIQCVQNSDCIDRLAKMGEKNYSHSTQD